MEAIPVPASTLCPQCHRPIPATANYCSNCGKKLNEPPLSTSIETQAWIYAFSIILPSICFLAVRHWPGIKYARSGDRKRKQIGFIAIALMAISTIISYWLAFVWINQLVQSLLNSVGNLGGFNGAESSCLLAYHMYGGNTLLPFRRRKVIELSKA